MIYGDKRKPFHPTIRQNEHFEKRTIDGMKHAEKQVGRILLLDGIPMKEVPK